MQGTAKDLDEKEIAVLKADLLAARTELQVLLDDTADSTRPVDSEEPIGRVSRMDAIQQQEMAQAEHLRSEHRLQLIDLALKKIDEGDFGYCTGCDGPIGFPRLKVRPEAVVCLKCQERLEGDRR